jgi:hypothetical protein
MQHGPKSLPLIVFVRLNSDPVAAQFITDALSELKQLGYDKLCIEAPYEASENELFDLYESTLSVARDLLQDVFKRFNYQGTEEHFLNTVSYAEMVQNLQKQSPQFEEMAATIELIRPYTAYLEASKRWKEAGGTLHGVDLEWPSHMDIRRTPLRDMELLLRLSQMSLLFGRENSIKKHLMSHYTTSVGTTAILTLGQVNILNDISARCAGNCLFVFPYTRMFRGLNTIGIVASEKIDISKVQLKSEVDTPEQRIEFLESLKKRIKEKIDSPYQPAITPAFARHTQDDNPTNPKSDLSEDLASRNVNRP